MTHKLNKNDKLYDREYKIEINATVDGQSKSITAITKTPKNSTQLFLSTASTKKFDDIESFRLKFQTINRISYYRIISMSKTADFNKFIWESPYLNVGDKNDKEVIKEVKDNLNYYANIDIAYTFLYKESNFEDYLQWFNFYFYDTYSIVLVAGNQDYKEYFSTFTNLKDIDGNFSEFKGNVKGNGFGVFAAAVSDTIAVQASKFSSIPSNTRYNFLYLVFLFM